MSASLLRGCCDNNNNNRLRTLSPKRGQRGPEGWASPNVAKDRLSNARSKAYNRNVDKNLLSLLLFFHSGSSSSMVAIDNKIEQAMDLVKSHLMYAVREEVEVLKEQIKELIDRNTLLEQENSLLKSLANPDQLSQLQTQLRSAGSSTGSSGSSPANTA
ncbi:TSC22 domain family protein 2-like [Scyliorhinus torazame]